MAATPSSCSPVYRNKSTLVGEKLKELYPKLKEKSRGIRVFYWSTSGQHCDHDQYHNESWDTQLKDGKSLEAGTVIALADFEVPEQGKHHLVAIRWDCGFVKVYSRLELANIRVFDLGPAGENIFSFK